VDYLGRGAPATRWFYFGGDKKDPDIPGGRFSYAEGEGIALLGRVTVPVEITPLGKWTYRYAGDANGVELYRASL